MEDCTATLSWPTTFFYSEIKFEVDFADVDILADSLCRDDSPPAYKSIPSDIMAKSILLGQSRKA
jgi:hypothetical protein